MKVNFLNRNLWTNYLAVLGTIGLFTSFLTIFITIKDEHKLWVGIGFLVFIVVIFIYLLYRANHTDNIQLTINGLKVHISYGDIFNSEGLKLIPFYW